jgi:hypothetical protein
MKKQIAICFFIFGLFQSLTCNGQNLADSTRTFRIETKDGNIFTGTIIFEDKVTLVIKTDRLGEIRIPQIDIKSKTELKEVTKVGGKIWLPNPQSSRYFWAPNGYGLEKGSSYYQNIWILYNQVSIGVADNFSIGAGVLPLFLFAGTPTPVWIVPKVSIPVVKNKFNIGTGAFLGTIFGAESGIFGLVYGTTTFGSRDKNVSLGLAYGFTRDQWMKVPIINFSSMIRYSPRSYFITENYAISIEGETLVLISLGGRTIIRNLGIDYSLWIPFGVDNSFVAIPFLGVTIPLGSKK